MPYRSERKQGVVERPEVGAVAEMVRQFADPYAFVRELVQNSIDAGATSISVRVSRAGGVATTVFRDDGAGMDRGTIEGPLLTLFNSSKEGDSTKIGKYGVGFVSVFAVDPEIVDVETWQKAGCYRVRLYRDHRYELERLSPREGSGTAVVLQQHMDAERFEEHCKRVLSALSRWCRYAAVPIEFSAADLDRGSETSPRRVDGVLTVPSPLVIEMRREGECIVVGPSAGAERFLASGKAALDDAAEGKATFAGFYCRGLTLFETEEALHPSLSGVRFRVDSPALRHTLSRDNVIRDRAFHRLIGQVIALVAGSLRKELSARLAKAARRLSKAKSPEEELVLSYVGMLEAAMRQPLSLDPKEIVLPLAGEWGDSRVATLHRVLKRERIWYVEKANEFSAPLLAADEPVLLAPHPGIVSVVASAAPPPGPLAPEKHWVLLTELLAGALSATDLLFLEAVRTALRSVGLRVDRVAFARGSSRIMSPVVIVDRSAKPVREGAWLCPRAHADNGWNTAKVRGILLLDVTDSSVEYARHRAKADVFVAAHLFTRVLLLARPDPSGAIADRLFEVAAKEIA